MASINDITIGQTIQFTSKATNDSNIYKGIVTGICDSTIAKFYNDIIGYNIQAKAADNTIPDVELLHFILLDLLEPISDSTITTLSFAKEWIEEANLNIIATQEKLDITVFDAGSSDIDDILNLLRGAGYTAAVST
jgi:hypothetical protein